MIETPEWLRPKINTVYPKNNLIEFERWFGENYAGDVSDREYLPIYWCGYQVNHEYGQDAVAMQRLQAFIDTLPYDKKYFTISQYDDSVGVDFKGRDVLIFDMSKNGNDRVPIPLIGQPHPYTFSGEKKYLANFIGSHTHPIREKIFALQGTEGFYISDQPHDIETYCRVISESWFTLCPRGYGINSFRIAESLQYGSVPVYISDKFIHPFYIDFNSFGLTVHADSPFLDDVGGYLNAHRMINYDDWNLKGRYETYFTYAGCRNKILQRLLSE
jgi:hypothetical protein